MLDSTKCVDLQNTCNKIMEPSRAMRHPFLSAIISTAVLIVGLLSSAASGATYYLDPNGSDGSDADSGTANKPWQHFAFALPKLRPGDTLILKNGTYNASNSGYPRINCGSNAMNGEKEENRRITVKAQNERQAFLSGSGESPLQITNCQYWTVEGLHLSNADNASTATCCAGAPINIVSSHNNIFRRLLVRNNNRWTNSHGLETYLSNNNLIEENEVYNFHRHGIIVQTGNGNIIRRNYVNSRGYADLPNCNNLSNGSGPWCSNNGSRGDNGLQVYPGSNNIFENNISEGNQFGFDVIARFGAGTKNGFFGNIANNNQYGFSLTAGCDNPTGQDMPQDSVFQNNVAINSQHRGFRLRSTKNAQGHNNSVIGPVDEGGWYADLDPSCPGDGAPTSYVDNLLVTHSSSVNASGVNISGQVDWSVSYTAIFNYSSNTPALTSSNITNERTDNPQLSSCKVFIPANSPLKGVGKDRADIGANVLYRYADGVLTTTPLWDPATGAFPCGAKVVGVNDVAGASCFDVHQRLNVNANGCLPACRLWSANHTSTGQSSDPKDTVRDRLHPLVEMRGATYPSIFTASTPTNSPTPSIAVQSDQERLTPLPAGRQRDSRAS